MLCVMSDTTYNRGPNSDGSAAAIHKRNANINEVKRRHRRCQQRWDLDHVHGIKQLIVLVLIISLILQDAASFVMKSPPSFGCVVRRHHSIASRLSRPPTDSWRIRSYRTTAHQILPRNHRVPISTKLNSAKNDDDEGIRLSGKEGEEEEVDVIIVGGGLGGLCAGAILRQIYDRSVLVLESHDTVGGCAHSYTRRSRTKGKTADGNGSTGAKTGGGGIEFVFDSGPTIVLGCSTYPRNPLQQVLEAVGEDGNGGVEWIPYDGWGMVINTDTNADNTSTTTTPQWSRWKFPVGQPSTSATSFQNTALRQNAGPNALSEFESLLTATAPLVSMGANIPAMAMRASAPAQSLIPLLRYPGALWDVLREGDKVTGPFKPYMDGPIFTIEDGWLRAWLDALAFSLSGLPAARTPAAAMAYVLYDLHRDGSKLDYPKGGMGAVSDALVKAIERGGKGKVMVNSHVERIDTEEGGERVVGVTLKRGGRRIKAKVGVICNAPIWSLRKLLDGDGVKVLDEAAAPATWRSKQEATEHTAATNKEGKGQEPGYLSALEKTEMTRSFLHLHVALDAKGIDLDAMEAHYTVMAKGLYAGDDAIHQPDPCGELNMVAVSNPCVLDRTLAPEGHIILHAYAAGNEPYEPWSSSNRTKYEALKQQRCTTLWHAIESIIPDARSRTVLAETGSPATHERFLRRPRGTYGAVTEDLLPDGRTEVQGLVLCGDSVFPGIGVPAVAVSGAGAANAMVGIWEQWRAMDRLKQEGVMS